MIIQLTNKCNINCFYCHNRYIESEENLSQDVVCEMVKEAVANGEVYFDFAGGEPLLYPDLENLVEKVKQIKGVQKVSITTNGILLVSKLESLINAGIDGINVHLDSTDAYTYSQITGCEQVLNPVLSGIWTAIARNISVAISVVLHEKSRYSLIVMAGLAKKLDMTVRFVEYGELSSSCQLGKAEVVKILSRHIKDLREDENNCYRSSEMKGKIVFSNQIGAAFA